MSQPITARQEKAPEQVKEEKPKKKLHRVQIDFSEKGYQQLLKLQQAAGTETISALVRDALGVYEWFIKEKNQDAEFLVRKNGEVERVSFLR